MQSSEGSPALTGANRHAVRRSSAGSEFRYTPPAVFLHWLMAVLIIFTIGLGLYMVAIEKEPRSEWYFDLHMSIGLTLAALLVLRVMWRLTHKPAALPARVPRWQAGSSRLLHWTLYAAMLVMPVAGFTGALYSKFGVTVFGRNLPHWVAPNHALSQQLLAAHSLVAWLLVATIALHILAGLKHLLLDRDGVFQRMWLS